jgi:hypothetical protein
VQGHDTHTQRARNFALQLPCLAKSFACASFVATSTRECRFSLAIAVAPQPPRASFLQYNSVNRCFLDKPT